MQLGPTIKTLVTVSIAPVGVFQLQGFNLSVSGMCLNVFLLPGPGMEEWSSAHLESKRLESGGIGYIGLGKWHKRLLLEKENIVLKILTARTPLGAPQKLAFQSSGMLQHVRC